MKRFYPSLLTLFLVSVYSVNASGQCVSSFPFTEDFELFDSIQQIESCNLTIRGDTANGWIQDPFDGGDWRADSSGTPSIGTGPGSTDTTNGVGVGTDYNPGKTSGIYLYTEATSATGCRGSSINLESPCLDFSSGKYYRMKLAYHMKGTGMGSLHVDVFDSTKWIKDYWKVSGDQGNTWKVATINLGALNRSNIYIRIRAVMGSNFLSDCAIDDITIEEYTPLDVDLAMLEVRHSSQEYYYIPWAQADSLRVWASMKNEGGKTANNAKYIVSNAAWSDSLNLGNLSSFKSDSGFLANKLFPSPSLSNTFLVRAKYDGSDLNPKNDSLRFRIQYSDSVYSREDGSVTNGIGFNGGRGEFGQVFLIRKKDTLTSTSVFFNAPTRGDSAKIHLYKFANNTIGAKIVSSKSVTLSSTGWYALEFTCDEVLDSGQYFLTIEQLNTNNLSVGYTDKFFTSGTTWFRATGGAWTRLEDLATPFKIAFLMRMNFGVPTVPKTSILAPDTVCAGTFTTLQAKGASTYIWGPNDILKDSTKALHQIALNESLTLTLKGTDQCGVSSKTSKYLHVKPRPSGTVSNDTIACVGDVIVLKASGGSGYAWTGGPSNKDWTYTVVGDRVVNVVIDSTNGCNRSMSVNVLSSQPTVIANNDTTVCQGSKVVLVAKGAGTYQWVGGPSSAIYSIRAHSNASYIVEGFNSLGCRALDTVNVKITLGPSITISNDTAVCFGQRVNLKVSGGISYEWTGGPSTSLYNLLPISTKYYYAKVTGTNGCSLTDSVRVEVGTIPTIALGNDTSICEGKTLVLTANTNDEVAFLWSTGATTKSISVSPKVLTKYKVTGSNTIGCSNSDSMSVNVSPLANASFEYTLTERDVTFKNNSTNTNTYNWDFGDGESSTDKNPFHRYAKDGTYSVKLTVNNNCGPNDTTVSIKIENLGVRINELGSFEISPNPFIDKVDMTIENSELGKVYIQVFNMEGKLVFENSLMKNEASFKTSIGLGELPAGSYLIQTKLNHLSSSNRILKLQ